MIPLERAAPEFPLPADPNTDQLAGLELQIWKPVLRRGLVGKIEIPRL
jgi:hypothetical protein